MQVVLEVCSLKMIDRGSDRQNQFCGKKYEVRQETIPVFGIHALMSLVANIAMRNAVWLRIEER
ncbi:MAG: hypothetical protein Q7T80_04125 [Methanoregula sp.]|nr:hypothetical protein [Methanoregula sp.]